MSGGPQACQGVVKKWFSEKGYGFLVPDGGSEDVFIHRRALNGAYELCEGDGVVFEAEFDDRRSKWKARSCYVTNPMNPDMLQAMPPGGKPGGGPGGPGGGGGKKGGGRGGGQGALGLDKALAVGLLSKGGGGGNDLDMDMGMGMGLMPGPMQGGAGGMQGGGRGGGKKGGGRGGCDKGGGFSGKGIGIDPDDGLPMGMPQPSGMVQMPQGMSMLGGGLGGGGGGGKKGGRGKGDGNKGKGGGKGRGGKGGMDGGKDGKGGGPRFRAGDVNLSSIAQQGVEPQMQVVAQLPLNWVQMRGPDGTFFVNSATREVTQDVPDELLQLVQQQQMQGQQQQQQQQMQQQMRPQQPPGPGPSMQQIMQMQGQMMEPPMPQQQQPPPAQPQPQQPQVKGRIGDWLICEDEQGLYYLDQRTSQTYDNPPPELTELMLMHQQQQLPPQSPPRPAQEPQAMYQQQFQQVPYPGPGGQFSDFGDMPQTFEHQSM